MATIEDLNKNAIKNQIQPKYIYREYCQNIFLSFLYQQKKSKQLLFKGGTALRIVYNSPRYSEDLDFTIIDLTNNEIEDMMVEVLSLAFRNQKRHQVDIWQISKYGCRERRSGLRYRLPGGQYQIVNRTLRW